MKEINGQIFKNTYLQFYDNYKKGNYVITAYYDKHCNKFLNVLDLDLMENSYYIEESICNSNNADTNKRLNYGYDD